MESVKEISLKDTSIFDERGWVVNPLKASGLSKDKLCNLHIVSIEPNTVRGKHFHTKSNEWLLVFGGSALFVWQYHNNSKKNTINIDGKEPILFYIPNNIEHAVSNTSNNVIYLLAFRDSKDDETIRSELLLD